MINDLFLRWATTLLFALAAAQCAYLMIVKRMGWPSYIGDGLHLIMSVAMGLMAWPFSMSWPTIGPMIFFIIAALWFLASMALPQGKQNPDKCGCVPPTSTLFGRAAALYHATMMGAMAWMYAVMNPTLLTADHSASAAMAMSTGSSSMLLAHDHSDMPGMDMPGMDMHSSHATQLGFVTPINWVLAIGFAIAAAYWLYLYFDRRRRPGAASDALSFAGDLCQVFMAVGMSIMFFVMVV